MKNARFLTLIAWFINVCVLFSCSEDDDYTTAATDLLRFSVDTLSMDTVITTLASPTYSFSIYNPHDKAIRIRAVRTALGADSPFRVNVDGVYINEGYEGSIEVWGKDSVAVFVSLTAPLVGGDTLQPVRDRLQFLLESGVTQEVLLEAYGQDVETARGWVIRTDTTLSSPLPYHVYDSLYVAEGATLTISPGVTFYFHAGAGMKVAGNVVARGTLQAPIVFRGDRLDDMFANQPYDRISGQWEGIHLLGTSYDNVFDFCDIHSAFYGIRCDSSDVSRLKLQVENSIIHNMEGNVLELYASRATVGNTQLTNALDYCVALYGGDTRFVHCTVANFYPFDFIRGGALYFTNALGNAEYPLHGAEFVNCIITGNSSDEVFGVMGDNRELAFNYRFAHCLVAMEGGEADNNFSDVVWDNSDNEVSGADNFRDFNLDYLTFDFRPDSLSAAIGSADYTTTCESYPFDRLGVSRTLDGKSDMGCYEAPSADETF